MAGGRFALIAKTHHALVDGISGVDITTVLFDTAPEPPCQPRARRRRGPPSRCRVRPSCSARRCSSARPFPPRWCRGARALLRAPRKRRRAAQGRPRERRRDHARGHQRAGAAEPVQRRHRPAPPLHVRRRRPGAVQSDQGLARRARSTTSCSPPSASPSAATCARRATTPRARAEGDGAGVGARGLPARRARQPGRRDVGAAAGRRREPGRLPGADHAGRCRTSRSPVRPSARRCSPTSPGFAPPTILSQAARLQARQRFFNLVVTNVPGPQFPLYLLGRRLRVLYPVVPLARRQALGIAVMSYDGHLGFGLLGDYRRAARARGDRARPRSGDRLARARGRRATHRSQTRPRQRSARLRQEPPRAATAPRASARGHRQRASRQCVQPRKPARAELTGQAAPRCAWRSAR